MADAHNPPPQPEIPPSSLPHESGSLAEILAATHLFTIGVHGVAATPWATGSDGLQHRKLRLDLELVQVFKGGTSSTPPARFTLEVEQRAERSFRLSDYHGFWSHQKPEAGARYLVLAEGASDSPAALLQEPAIRELLDVARVDDVRWALEAERVFGGTLRNPQAREELRRTAAHGLLAAAQRHRARLGGLAARYLWARVLPVYEKAEEELFPDLLTLLQAQDAQAELRGSLARSLYDSALSLGVTPERSRRLLRPFFGLLLDPTAAPLQDLLLQVPIYNLLFRPGEAPPAPAAVLPPGLDRGRLKALLSSSASAKSQEILAWLDTAP